MKPPEYHEGPEALKRFGDTMTALFRVPKATVTKETERRGRMFLKGADAHDPRAHALNTAIEECHDEGVSLVGNLGRKTPIKPVRKAKKASKG